MHSISDLIEHGNQRTLLCWLPPQRYPALLQMREEWTEDEPLRLAHCRIDFCNEQPESGMHENDKSIPKQAWEGNDQSSHLLGFKDKEPTVDGAD